MCPKLYFICINSTVQSMVINKCRIRNNQKNLSPSLSYLTFSTDLVRSAQSPKINHWYFLKMRCRASFPSCRPKIYHSWVSASEYSLAWKKAYQRASTARLYWQKWIVLTKNQLEFYHTSYGAPQTFTTIKILYNYMRNKYEHVENIIIVPLLII